MTAQWKSDRAFLVGVEFTQMRPRAESDSPAPVGDRTSEESLDELQELAGSAGAIVVGRLLQRRPQPDPALLIGSGKLQELRDAVECAGADLIIVDGEISATQQRNLEVETGVRIASRTQLILDIFARHARTREGQLQVELAQLEYLLPRLTGRGVSMSRLGGGIGTRGPGETQLETDRRLIHRRIRNLRLALSRVRDHRGQQRRQRESVPLATVALVGYTNAGKSTLFNQLTGAAVLTSRQMFSTLDPTLRAVTLPSHRKILLSDTVGFLRNLPHGLISAFRATLEEVMRAQLLLVVSDGGSPFRQAQGRQIEAVLHQLEVSATPRIQVWNKADLLSPETRRHLLDPNESFAAYPQVLASARTGEGLDALRTLVDRQLQFDPVQEVRLRIPQPAAGPLVHLLYERGEVIEERYESESVCLVARIPESLLRRFESYRVS